jgi:hypothetical protein
MVVLRAIAVALYSAMAVSQTQLVSPTADVATEGRTSNALPWCSTTPRRYLQLHGDLGGAPRTITRLSFRVDAAAQTYVGTRTHDIEVWMGEGVPWSQPRFRFDDNYIGPRTLVLPRTTVTFGPQGQSHLPGPSTFTGMDLTLATPFQWSGTNSLVWEVVYYGQVAATGLVGTYANCDAEEGTLTWGSTAVTGLGCIASGQSEPMAHTLTCCDVAGQLLLNATLFAAPAGAPCLLALGIADPALALPGLCGLPHTDAAMVLPIGSADALGRITTDHPAAATFVLPNVLPGLMLRSQVLALDPARPDPIGVCVSDGRAAGIPGSDRSRSPAVSRVFNMTGGATASEGAFFVSTVGCGLVTRFSCQ